MQNVNGFPFFTCRHGTGYYSPKKFLDILDSKPKKWHSNLISFTNALDAKVTIRKDNQEHADIIKGVQTLVDFICAELPKHDEKTYKGVTRISTGSQNSGFKVGLPHESDFLLKLTHKPEPKDHSTPPTQYKEAIVDAFYWCVTEIALTFSHDGPLRVQRVLRHERVPGVCVVMEYIKDEKSHVGATIDLVLCVPYDNITIQNLRIQVKKTPDIKSPDIKSRFLQHRT